MGADLDPWNNIFGECGALFTLCLGGGSGYFAAALGARWRSEQNICNFTRRAGSPFDH